MMIAKMKGLPIPEHDPNNPKINIEEEKLYKSVPPLAEEVFEEIKKVWPDIAGISYERLEKEGGIQWRVLNLITLV
ncbi:hypothetical protein [Thermodesulfatator indicus]|uniref:hypothetical protein n=1 Tax=Thermodesulfatator indicus TaxID=171695 RepID=UPI0006933A4C|nr:hypothetical protein [Thermodesulfatator indicus]